MALKVKLLFQEKLMRFLRKWMERFLIKEIVGGGQEICDCGEGRWRFDEISKELY